MSGKIIRFVVYGLLGMLLVSPHDFLVPLTPEIEKELGLTEKEIL